MANSRDFTGKNRKFTGTKGITVSKGTTDERVGSESGEFRFNTTTTLMEYYDGTIWKPIDAPPSISSITTNDATGSNIILNSDGSTIYTVTINGNNFSTSVDVKFVGSTGTLYTAGNITRVSVSQITCTTLSSMSATDDPYAIRVTNTAANLSATLESALTFNAPPVFVNAAGSIGFVWNGRVVSSSTLDASATDAEGNTITYTKTSGNFPGSGLSLSSSTGYITGTVSGTPSLGNYPFTIRASTTEGFTERQFHIEVVAVPFIAASGGTETTDGNFKIHTFTGPGSLTVTNAGTPLGSTVVDYLVVGGGGSGRGNQNATGGGGAGGFRLSNATGMPAPNTSPLANPTGLTVAISPGSYPITVGGGGAGGGNGAAGASSVFSTITSAGGGSPNGNNTPGLSGGSGGGGVGGASFPVNSTGGAGNTPPVAPPQGNDGGRGFDGHATNTQGGGGGGAGAVGGNAGQGSGAPGGVGSYVLATGFAGANGTTGPVPGVRYFSGGGGGGTDTPSGSTFAGGSGGGGQGGNGGVAGTANTGGGGGGGPNSVAGGSGIVIIRYRYQ
jgi:hypothetical protein